MSAPYRVAIASRAEAREAAEEILGQGGSAVDAALAGFLAAAAATSWAFFAPVTVVTAGAGSGVRFVDGRARQPGEGLERAKRYADEKSVPAVALVSASMTPAAIALAQAMFAQTAWSQLVGPALRVAKREGVEQRARLLDGLAKKKVLLLNDRDLLAEFKARASRIDGALLGPEDLETPRAEIANGVARKLGSHASLVAPWAFDEGLAAVAENGRLLVMAADARGGLGMVVADRPARALPIYEGEVELPMLAQPVLKGVPRLKPGSALPMAAPAAVLVDGDRPSALVGSMRRGIDDEQLDALVASGASPLPGWGEHATDRTDDLLVVRRAGALRGGGPGCCRGETRAPSIIVRGRECPLVGALVGGTTRGPAPSPSGGGNAPWWGPHDAVRSEGPPPSPEGSGRAPWWGPGLAARCGGTAGTASGREGA